MTDYFAKNVGKWMFPQLARDERKRRIRTILLVVTACLFSAIALSSWMVFVGGSHSIPMPDLSLWQR